MTTYTWPQTINGVTFTAADFAPYAYVTGLPNLVGNMVASFNTGNATLSALGMLTPAPNKLAYFSSTSTAALADLTAAGRALLDDADPTEQRATLGLGTAATQNTGTSGATVPLLDTAVTFSAALSVAAVAYLGGAAGTESLRALATSSFVNRFEIQGAATTARPLAAVAGGDTNIGSSFGTKGTSTHLFTGNGATQFLIGNVASAVNYVIAQGAATTGNATLTASGSDTNVGYDHLTKGSGTFRVKTDAVNGYTQFGVAHTAAAVNYQQFTGAATGSTPLSQSTGSDTDISSLIRSKGVGTVRLATGGGLQSAILDVASAVNYWQLAGAATTAATALNVAGSDTDVSIQVGAKGGGSVSITTGGGRQFRVGNNGSAVNYAEVNGGATGVTSTVGFWVGGSDTNIFSNYYAKGTGGHRFWANSGEQFRVGITASVVNYILAEGGNAGAAVIPGLSVGGSDTNVWFNFYSKGTSGHRLWTNGAEQVRVDAVASAVNFALIYGATTGNGASYAVGGSDTNADANHRTKGTGAFVAVTGGGVQFKATHVASAVNWAAALGATTNNAPEFYADGGDSNIYLQLHGKGSNGHRFFANGVEQVRIGARASAVNYWFAEGGTTGSSAVPALTAAGADANVFGNYLSQGAAGHRFLANGEQLRITAIASAVNYCSLSGGTTGSAVLYGADGTDTNVSVQIRAKGTGDLILSSLTDSTMVRVGRLGAGVRIAYVLNGTAPSVAPPGGAYLWSEGGVLKAMGASGVVTTLAA